MFPVELLGTEKGPECLWCFGRNTLQNLGVFFVAGFYFPLISGEISLWALLQLQEGSWDLTSVRGTIIGLIFAHCQGN